MNSSVLTKTVRELLAHWERVEPLWRDIRSAQFQERYIEPLPDITRNAEVLMEELGRLLNKIRNDCE